MGKDFHSNNVQLLALGHNKCGQLFSMSKEEVKVTLEECEVPLFKK